MDPRRIDVANDVCLVFFRDGAHANASDIDTVCYGYAYNAPTAPQPLDASQIVMFRPSGARSIRALTAFGASARGELYAAPYAAPASAVRECLTEQSSGVFPANILITEGDVEAACLALGLQDEYFIVAARAALALGEVGYTTVGVPNSSWRYREIVCPSHDNTTFNDDGARARAKAAHKTGYVRRRMDIQQICAASWACSPASSSSPTPRHDR